MDVKDLDRTQVQVMRTRSYCVLNEKVFDLDECPDWAQWAAVDEDGKAHWFDSQPCMQAKRWNCKPRGTLNRICFGCLFDPTDWQHSLIKRSEKVLQVTMADLEKKYGCKIKTVKES